MTKCRSVHTERGDGRTGPHVRNNPDPKRRRADRRRTRRDLGSSDMAFSARPAGSGGIAAQVVE